MPVPNVFLAYARSNMRILMAQFFFFFVKALSPELGHPPTWSVEPQTLTKEHHTQTKPTYGLGRRKPSPRPRDANWMCRDRFES
jgi:hypothetical protein